MFCEDYFFLEIRSVVGIGFKIPINDTCKNTLVKAEN